MSSTGLDSPPPPPGRPSTEPTRLDPLTPVVGALQRIPLAVAVAFFLPSFGGVGLTRIMMLLGTMAAVVVAIAVYHYIVWTRTTYFFDDSGDFRVDSGLLERTERRVQLSRLQSVDITEPLLAPHGAEGGAAHRSSW